MINNTFANIKGWFAELCRVCYRLEPSNSFLLTSTRNIDLVTPFFAEEGFKIVTGLCYLGSYLGAAKDAQDYMPDKLDN